MVSTIFLSGVRLNLDSLYINYRITPMVELTGILLTAVPDQCIHFILKKCGIYIRLDKNGLN